MRGKGGTLSGGQVIGDLPCLTRVGFLGSRLGTASRRGGSGVDAGGGPLWPPAAEGCGHLGKKPTCIRGAGVSPESFSFLCSPPKKASYERLSALLILYGRERLLYSV